MAPTSTNRTLDPVPAAENVLGVTVTPDEKVEVSTRQPPPFVVKTGTLLSSHVRPQRRGVRARRRDAAGTPPAPVSAGLAGARSPNAVDVVTSNPTDAFNLAVIC